MSAPATLEILRCRDVAWIERHLIQDYFDYPVCNFSPAVCRAAGRWLARTDAVYFMTATVGDEPAGFVLGHTLGRQLWRRFAVAHPLLLPALARVLLNHRFNLGGQIDRSRFQHALPKSCPEKIAVVEVPRVAHPFSWTPMDGTIGYIPLLYVAPTHRGRGVASALLRGLIAQMQADRVRRCEAHVDPGNYASLAAFLRAGWQAIETGTNDFLTFIEIP